MITFRHDIALLWLSGVFAAAQLSKFSAIGPDLQSRFGLTLTALGWLISLLEVGGAAFGLIAGLLLNRIGTPGARSPSRVDMSVTGESLATLTVRIGGSAVKAAEGVMFV